MTNKEQKLYSFYSQCIEKNYIDMNDDTQSLKAKVIASDLGLKYGKIVALFEEAKSIYEAEEIRKKAEAEKEAAEAARTSVQGSLFVKLIGVSKKPSFINIYRRPDGSVYCTKNNDNAKIEGAPVIEVRQGGILSYTYHPSKTVFTGASSGGIAMGGFHQTEAYTTEKVSNSGKGDIHAKSGDMEIWVETIELSDDTVQAFKRDTTFNELRSGNRITCIDRSGASFSKDIMTYTIKNPAGYQDYMAKGSLAVDMMKLPMEKVQLIAKILNNILTGNYPPTDEELYSKGLALMESAKSEELKQAVTIFESIKDYRDSTEKARIVQARYEEILQAEKENRILQKERDDRKRKKILSLIAVAAIIGVATFFVITKVIIPNENYKKAIALKNAGNYEEAINAFSVMNRYKDSAEQIKECQYYEAISLKDTGYYEEAIDAFRKLYGYKDSTEQINFCKSCIQDKKYNAAAALKDAGNYAEAITAFEELDGYKDSAEQINFCKICIQDIKYGEALSFKENGDYEKAISEFKALAGYLDSADQIVECELSMMKNVKAGEWITFGSYEQDNDFSNGKEGITWIVLKKTNDSILVTSKYVLDCQQYNTQSGIRDDTTWETCSLRKWLNEDFLSDAFSEEEQVYIKNEVIPAHKNPDYNTNPGNSTTDRVFLLSINEADEYFKEYYRRKCRPTEFAKNQGVWINEDTDYCWWWLRTPGSKGFEAALVNYEGSIIPRGGHVNDDTPSNGVRPALWISIN